MYNRKEITFCKNDVMISRYGKKIVINFYHNNKITPESKARLEKLQYACEAYPLTLFELDDNSAVFTIWRWKI